MIKKNNQTKFVIEVTGWKGIFSNKKGADSMVRILLEHDIDKLTYEKVTSK